MSKTNQRIQVTREVNDPFARVPKNLLDDDSMSWKAKGILAYLLSKPESWKLRVNDIAQRSTDGESSVRTALKELQATGYAKLERVKGDDGKIAEWVWHVSDKPAFLPKKPDGGFPDVEKPEVEKPHVENRRLSKKDYSKKDYSKKDNIPSTDSKPVPMTERCKRIYEAYPRKVGRAAALRAIVKACRVNDPATVEAAARKFGALWAHVPIDRMTYVPYPATWFNQERFLDDPATWPSPKPEDRAAQDDGSGWDLDEFMADVNRKEGAHA